MVKIIKSYVILIFSVLLFSMLNCETHYRTASYATKRVPALPQAKSETIKVVNPLILSKSVYVYVEGVVAAQMKAKLEEELKKAGLYANFVNDDKGADVIALKEKSYVYDPKQISLTSSSNALCRIEFLVKIGRKADGHNFFTFAEGTVEGVAKDHASGIAATGASRHTLETRAIAMIVSEIVKFLRENKKGEAEIIAIKEKVEDTPPEEPLSPNASSAVKRKVVVLPFKDTGQEAKKECYGEAFSELVVTALIKIDKFIITERSQLEKLLEERKFKLTDLVEDEAKAREMAKILNSEYIIIGTVSKFGDTLNFNARIVHSEAGNAIAAASTSVSSEAQMNSAASKIATDIVNDFVSKEK